MNKCEQLSEWLEDQELTEDVYEAIFILEDGRLVGGQFDMGMRGLDHNCIISLAPGELTHPEKWSYIHDTFGVIRTVPETCTALIDEGQAITEAQQAVLSESNYEIEEY